MTKIDALLAIMARLRDPATGCPWDLEQDFESISPHTIEEAYEVDEAIASGDLEALRDELGDLLFQVVFQARLAEEKRAFDFDGVVEAIVDKLIRRHPHVFADAETPGSVEKQLENWEEIKAAERAAAAPDGTDRPDPFAGIPRNLPALARSAKIAGRFERLDGVEARPSLESPGVVEELVECARAARDLAAASGAARVGESEKGDAPRTAESDPTSGSGRGSKRRERSARVALVGRGLRAWVSFARSLGIDPEQALRQVDDERVSSIRAKRLQASPPGSR